MTEFEKFNWDVHGWTTNDNYFAQNKILTQHQIESYNDFIDYVVPQIIERNNPVIIATDYSESIKDFKKKYVIEFLQTYLSKPLIQESNDVIKPLYPNEARLRGLTYSAPMFMDVRHRLIIKDDEGNEKQITDHPMSAVESKIPFVKMPVVLHSKYCHLSDKSGPSLAEMGECRYDQGGYFIVNGGEKVIVAQERVAENQVYGWPPSKNPTSKYSHEVEIKSSIDQRFYPVKTNKVKLTKESSTKAIKDSLPKASGLGGKTPAVTGRTLRVQMPHVKEDIPLFIMFRALGVTTEKEIFEMILSDLNAVGSNYINMLLPSVEESRAKGVTTQESALHYISKQLNLTFSKDFQEQDKDVKLKYVKDIINREFLPHIGQNNRKKAFFLGGNMTRGLLDRYFGVRPYDDRDHLRNKRVDLTGPLLTALFRANFIKLVRDLRQQILPKLTSGLNGLFPSLRKIIQGCSIESKIKYGLSTGNWSTQKSAISSSKKGIAQVLNRLSFPGALSHTRRVQSPLERSGSKIIAPRKLHGTHYGMCSPNETPEGGQVGIVKNFAMETHVTIQTSDYPIRIALTGLGVDVKELTETSPQEVHTSTKIFVNGDWFGVVADRNAKELYDKLRVLKRHGIIVPYISIAWYIDWKEIHIQTDGGRYSRPLYIVDNNTLLIKKTFDENESFRNRYNDGKIKWMQFLSDSHRKPPAGTSASAETGVAPATVNLDNGALIEYLDVNEIETAMIAMTMADIRSNKTTNDSYVYFTHCELHPMMMMGIVDTMIPLSDHNPSPRNCYQCLSINEEVIMSDGSRKKISEIKVGDYVITVDPKTLEQKPSKVINQYVKSTDKKIIELTTLSGRRLIATDDHPILTKDGWKRANLLTKDDLICVCPTPEYYPFDKSDLIIDEAQFVTKCQNLGIKDSLISKHCDELKNLRLLPLYQNDQNAAILARICGFNMTDGSTGVYRSSPQIQMTFGLRDSAIHYVNDIEELGFSKHEITEVESFIHGARHHGWQVIYNNAFASLIMTLGVPVGKKTENPSPNLQDWIKQGSKIIKREFLAGFQGGDGCKIRYNNLNKRKSPNFILNVTSMQKCEKYLDSLKSLMSEIKILFEEFGVICKDITIRKSDKAQDRHTVELPFECSRQNIINYFERIGYKYDLYKYRDSLPIYEYLKYQESMVSEIDDLKEKITKYVEKEHHTYPYIAKLLGISVTKCNSLYRARDMTSRMPNKDYLSIGEWLKKVKVENRSIFVPLGEIKPQDNIKISDITISEDTHSFITGGQICVHNSSMGKQSIGFYVSNYNSRMDSLAHVLVYGHRPLVVTRTTKYTLTDKLPHGTQAMLSMQIWTGYNQEDSTILNGDAVERGLFNTIFYRTYSDKEQKHKSATTASEKFMKADKTKTGEMKHGSYAAINEDGIPIVGSIVKGGDVIIGKTVESKEADASGFLYKDVSTTVRQNEGGTIDLVIPDPKLKMPNFNAEGHKFIKARVAILRKPEIGDKFACFDDKTEILTTQGWKSFERLDTDDHVASLRNNQLVYVNPTQLQSYPVSNQRMYTVKTQQVNLKVTPNHRMYVKKRYSENFVIENAEDVYGKRIKFKKNCEYVPQDWIGDKFTFESTTRKCGHGIETLDDYVVNMDDWLVFFGIWMAEGWAETRSGHETGYLTISANKPRVQQALEEIEKTSGWHFMKCQSSMKWKLCNKQIYDYLKPLSVGATNKYLPTWVWKLNQEQSRKLLHNMCLGDGHKTKSDTQYYYTSSTQLADDFQRLCLHAGWSANIRIRSEAGTPYEIEGRTGVTTATAYYISIIKTKNEPQINHGHIKEQQDTWESYTGNVYCCTVPSGLIYVRREGIPVWSGNSRHAQKGTGGMLYPMIDLPLTSLGETPDVIMNPHSLPSRMTLGLMLELLLGKRAVCEGKPQDGTPLTPFDLQSHKDLLKSFGLDEYGNEVMYNGQTGQMFTATSYYGPTYYQRLKHMVDDKIHCVPKETEVLTAQGWKFIDRVTLDDEVATLKDNKLVYEKPTQILHYPDYQGDMYHIKNQQIDLMVTTNHRMWVSLPFGRKKVWQPYQLMKAEAIVGKHVKYQKDADWDQPDYQFELPQIIDGNNITHPPIAFNMDAWLIFFGIWIAEGWTTPHKTPSGPNTYSYRIQICQCKQRVKDKILDAIAKLGYNCCHPDDKITITDKQLYTYLSPLSVGAPNKYLPDWVWKLSKPQCQLLINSMILGDGSFVGSSIRYYTSSIKLADDFMKLCLHAGWSANKTLHEPAGHITVLADGREIKSNHDMWRLGIVKTKNNPAVNHGHHKDQQIQVEEIIKNIKQPVYCLQVPSEVFYVRRNGKPVWTGNSRESGPVQMLTRQPAEGRSRDGGLRLGEMERDCLIAHGSVKFLKERMMDSSDLFKVYVSKKEEAIIVGNAEKRIFKFNGKPLKDDEISEIQLPYAMKLLLQEEESIGTDIRLGV